MKSRAILSVALLLIVVVGVFVVFYAIKAQNQTSVDQMKKFDSSVYQQHCERCHGIAGKGFASFPAIDETELSVAEIKAIILNGKGEMPGFSNIKEPELSQLAQYVKDM